MYNTCSDGMASFSLYKLTLVTREFYVLQISFIKFKRKKIITFRHSSLYKKWLSRKTNISKKYIMI